MSYTLPELARRSTTGETVIVAPGAVGYQTPRTWSEVYYLLALHYGQGASVAASVLTRGRMRAAAVQALAQANTTATKEMLPGSVAEGDAREMAAELRKGAEWLGTFGGEAEGFAKGALTLLADSDKIAAAQEDRTEGVAALVEKAGDAIGKSTPGRAALFAGYGLLGLGGLIAIWRMRKKNPGALVRRNGAFETYSQTSLKFADIGVRMGIIGLGAVIAFVLAPTGVGFVAGLGLMLGGAASFGVAAPGELFLTKNPRKMKRRK